MTAPPFRIAAIAVLAMPAGWGAEPVKPRPEPKITSINPLTVPAGREAEITILGTALASAHSVLFADSAIPARIIRAGETEVSAAVTLPASGCETAQPFRVVTGAGVSNEAKVQCTTWRVASERDPIGDLPALINGVLSKRAEIDSFVFEARAGETIVLQAVSGLPAFDPAVSIWAPARSWFDENRMERVAFQDEPLYFPGLDNSPRLVHRFERGGRYEIRIGAFHGQGGPGYSYSLRLSRQPEGAPDLHPIDRPEWPERWFTRRLGPEWLNMLPVRGNEKPLKPIETYHAVIEGSSNVPIIDETGLIEGRLGAADEAHEIRLKIAAPRDLAIEIETPEATMPRFNPVVRVMQPDGHEVVTNVYTKLNNNGLYMMKMIQAKTAVTLRSVGEYRIQIRDITSDCWSKDFAYRVLIRPQVPHLGEITLAEDRVNLEPGQSKPLTVTVDREEGFKGFVAIAVEGLPPGVTAVTGLENPVEKPPLPNAGRRERYYPVPQTATVVLVAAPGAPPQSEPARVRVSARPVVEGRAGDPVFVKTVPVMVVGR